MKEKTLITCLSAIGILAVAYGIYKENDTLFVIGILFVIAGYLSIRRKLKKSREHGSNEIS